MAAQLYRLAPGEIRSGRRAVRALPELVAGFGAPCVFIHDAGGGPTASDARTPVSHAGADPKMLSFAGECTAEAIDRLVSEIADETIVAFGGGKVLDAAKAAAVKKGVPCVTVPTSAATCAAYTPLAILHEADGAYVESRRLSQPVAAMVLDPDILVTAPPRLLAAGMADAAARAFDTILASRGPIPSATAALSLAICREYLFECILPLGSEALADNVQGVPTDAFTRVAEACILGAGLAGETGTRFFGRSFSHAVAYALSHVVDAEGVLHGEAAGLGILLQFVLDPAPPVPYATLRDAFSSWDLPVSFAEVGIEDLSGEPGEALAARTYGYLDLERAVPFDLEPRDILDGLRAVEERVRRA